jgi:DNA repair exonuclease SbcCD ATPase subunit
MKADVAKLTAALDGLDDPQLAAELAEHRAALAELAELRALEAEELAEKRHKAGGRCPVCKDLAAVEQVRARPSGWHLPIPPTGRLSRSRRHQ